MDVRRWVGCVVVVGTLLAGAACGGKAGDAGNTGKAGPDDKAGTELLADGRVPWLDEPLTSVRPSPSQPTVRPGSKPCTAGQLAGQLDRWWIPKPGAGGGGGAVLAPEGVQLIGEVEVRNTSDRDCTLRGEVDTRLYSGGVEVPISYSHGISREARERVVPAPAGGRVMLRLDWSGPYCATAKPPFELRINLPDGGGALQARVVPTDTPPCSRSETHPNLSSDLYSSGFSPPPTNDPEADVESPLRRLTSSVTGPATATSGERVSYTVTLANPTDAPVPLAPCPGYLQELSSQGSGDAAGHSSSQLYQLNCRPVAAVPAHGELRFEMVAVVPAELKAGRQLRVGWRIVTRQSLPSNALYVSFTLRIA
jgi:hypothetical protein